MASRRFARQLQATGYEHQEAIEADSREKGDAPHVQGSAVGRWRNRARFSWQCDAAEECRNR